MPIAAVPSYLGNDFADASPGLRFGLLLSIWTSRPDQENQVKDLAAKKSKEGKEVADLLASRGMDATIVELCRRERSPLAALWDKSDFGAREAWSKIKRLTKRDIEQAKALVERQRALADTTAHVLCLDAVASAPFTTGLGNEHPLENGFAFLNPYGLPYLPGSGVKGVLRQAARELASGAWGEAHGWSEDKRYGLQAGRQRIALSLIDVLFGLESGDGDTNHVRGALSFWDVIPQIAGSSLMVEIMTPHQTHYYQHILDRKSGNSVSPHDSGQPNPICFLTIPPGSQFSFHVVCDDAHLQRLTRERQPAAPDPLAEGASHWKTLIAHAFEHAFQWLGFGAKTAVGYGAMQRDAAAEAKAFEAARKRAEEEQRRREAAEREARRALLSENMRRIEDFKADFAARAEELRGGREKPNAAYHDKARKLAKDAQEADGWTAEEKRAAAEAIEEWLPKVVKVEMKDERKRLKLAALKGQQ